MAEPDPLVVRAMQDMIAANAAARDVLTVNNEALERSIERLRAGEKITDIFLSSPSSDFRQSTQDALRQLATARHAFRLRVIAEFMAEGRPAWEIANAWGFSRQRLDRYMQEIKNTGSG